MYQKNLLHSKELTNWKVVIAKEAKVDSEGVEPKKHKVGFFQVQGADK